MKQSIATKIRSAPHEPGIYIFRNGKTILYVGKAADLKNRLHSYLKITDDKTAMLHENATKLNYIVLQSDIEALIQESRLIKELKPKYNVIWRDDKSYHYVYFTKDEFSKIFVAHEKLTNRYSLVANRYSRIGPFTDGTALRTVMKILRRYFPYCTCFRPHLRDCLNAQIGKCYGFCCHKNYNPVTDEITKYGRNIRTIKAILRGHAKKLLSALTDKEKLALENIFEHQPFLANSQRGLTNRKEKSLLASGYTSRRKVGTPTSLSENKKSASELNPKRVECFDLSNLSGKEAVGVMTVLKDGLPDKNQWRKFKIKRTPTRDDPRMMAEIVSRRLKHPEWLYPDLMIIDGGLTQFHAAKKIFKKHLTSHVSHPTLISFSKPEKLVYGLKPNDEPTPLAELPAELQKLIEKAIYYTHGFAVRYHRKVRSKEFFS